MKTISAIVAACVNIFNPSTAPYKPTPYDNMLQLERMIQAGEYKVNGKSLLISYIEVIGEVPRIEFEFDGHRHKVLAEDRNGNAWIGSSSLDVSRSGDVVKVLAFSMADDGSNTGIYTLIEFKLGEHGRPSFIHFVSDYVHDPKPTERFEIKGPVS